MNKYRCFNNPSGGGGGGSGHSYDFDDHFHLIVEMLYGEDANHHKTAPTEDGYVTFTDNENNWTDLAGYRIDRESNPETINSIKFHLASLEYTDYGGFFVIVTNYAVVGKNTSDRIISQAAVYLENGVNGSQSKTDYEITVDISNASGRYIYFGICDGKESTAAGYNNKYNGSASAKIDWFDINPS